MRSVLCVQCVCERERDRGRECMYVSDVYNVKSVQKDYIGEGAVSYSVWITPICISTAALAMATVQQKYIKK